MPNTQRISEMTTAAVLNDSDMMELSQADEMAQSGYSTKKTTIVAVANKIAKAIQFADLQTASKNLVGAINEAAQSGGGSDVEVTPILTEGTKIATITVDDVDTDIYAENTKEELEKLSAEKTVTGNPITFETINGGMTKSCEVTMNPIQDLHGYDYPWVGGAGKNLAKPYSYSAGIHSYDGNGNVTISGTVQASSYVPSISTGITEGFFITLQAGTYKPSTEIPLPSGLTINVMTKENRPLSQGSSFTITEETDILFRVAITEAGTYNWTSGLMLEAGSQATDYAPYSNICPISGRDSVDVVVTGKNQLDTTNSAISGNNMWFYGNGNIYKFWKAGTYTFSYEGNSNHNVSIYKKKDTDGLNSTIVDRNNTSATFTIPEDGNYIFFAQVTTGISTSDCSKPMIEIGSSATDFEEYKGKSVTIQLGKTVYYGILDVVTGVLKILGAIVDLGSLTYTRTTAYTNPLFYVTIPNKKISSINSVCEIFKNGGLITGAVALNNMENSSFGAGNNSNIIYIRDDRYSTAEDFKTAMNGVQLEYELATPIEVALTPQAIELLKGNNTVSSDADELNLKYSEMMGLDDVKALIDEAIGTVLNTEF